MPDTLRIFDLARQLWHEMKTDYDAALVAAMRHAERDTNGVLVNRDGRAKGITADSLFTGNTDRAIRYASEELIEHWSHHGRLTLTTFETQWLAGRHVWN